MIAPIKTLVVVNPAAGGGRARRAEPLLAGLLRKHGWPAEFFRSSSAADIRRIARAGAESGYGVVAVLGGDGAFHHAVNGAFGTNVVFGLFPAGHGNDIARALGISPDPLAAAEVFLHGWPRRVDLLRARFTGRGEEYYLGAGGLGLDAEAARLVNTRFKRLPGALRYIAAALWAKRTFQPLELEVEMDGAEAPQAAGPVLFAAVANSPWYGAGVCIAPAAKNDDGELNVTLVGALPWLRILEAIPVALRTGDLRWPEIQRCTGRRVVLRVRGGRAALFHGDGEVLGEAPVEIEVLPGAIGIIGR